MINPKFRLSLALVYWAIACLATVVSARSVRASDGEFTEIDRVDFERHVAGLLNRLGCSTGACHGSFQGRGGFKLALFGQDPERDYHAITRDSGGRRVDLVDPDRSLILRKAAAIVPHEGGRRIEKNSWEYRVIRSWIAQGARRRPGVGTVKKIDISSGEHVFERTGESIRLRVAVEFEDGSREDVSRFCVFQVKNESVAEIDATGRVVAKNKGSCAVVVSYRGAFAWARVIVPATDDRRDRRLARSNSFLNSDPLLFESENVVDREVAARLRKLRIEPSAPASDSEFLRRISIDAIGSLPSPEEVRAFLADDSPNKRSAKVDELLYHPMHADLWASRFCDLTALDVAKLEVQPDLADAYARVWRDWFRHRIAAGTPYDQIVRGVLCATSRGGEDVKKWVEEETKRISALGRNEPNDFATKPELDLFWMRNSTNGAIAIEPAAELVASSFLGVRIACAQCHRHPFDRWTRRDYRAFANIFAQVRTGRSIEADIAFGGLLERLRARSADGALPPTPAIREVFLADDGESALADPDTDARLAPRALGGPDLSGRRDIRQAFCDRLVDPANPFFARNFVNRVWACYFGVGLVDPVDGFSASNPPSNERLLDALAKKFTNDHYSILKLERTILTSRTYSLSSIPNDSNRFDRSDFSHTIPRRPPAEAVLDMIADATGKAFDFDGDAPAGSRAIEVATNRPKNEEIARAFRTFGRPDRKTTCECERSNAAAIAQTLYLMTEPAILDRIKTGRLAKLLDSGASDDQAIDELFLATFSRFPSADEKRAAVEAIERKNDRRAAFVDVFWTLLNAREFSINH